jgi:regulator of replication initiation timing
MSKKNIWYLEGPFHQYQEDVKALAKERGLRIVDANMTDSREDEAVDVPEVTTRPELRVLVVDGSDNGSAIEAMRRELEAVGLIVEDLATGDLQRPEEGEMAIRLFEGLTQMSQNFQSLITERDRLVTNRDELTRENESLLATNRELKEAAAKQISDADEVDAMKAKLDAAGVSYRSNASKDSLEKLVADLPPA